MARHIRLLCVFWDLMWGPHACTESCLHAEPSPRLSLLHLTKPSSYGGGGGGGRNGKRKKEKKAFDFPNPARFHPNWNHFEEKRIQANISSQASVVWLALPSNGLTGGVANGHTHKKNKKPATGQAWWYMPATPSTGENLSSAENSRSALAFAKIATQIKRPNRFAAVANNNLVLRWTLRRSRRFPAGAALPPSRNQGSLSEWMNPWVKLPIPSFKKPSLLVLSY